ncbi:hypothetical protein CEXT_517891 [Caerostris extrusa]|uniref:Uncharacterized protein n=1 Tax=Caerostris extrusa TaxID=172846 RepID=A0AAV4SDR9_CAEEX|nr:hypothetical protein CEXT_517891 [Caerostris extrusa]
MNDWLLLPLFEERNKCSRDQGHAEVGIHHAMQRRRDMSRGTLPLKHLHKSLGASAVTSRQQLLFMPENIETRMKKEEFKITLIIMACAQAM